MQMPSRRTRILTGAAVLAAVGVSAAGAIAVAAPDTGVRAAGAPASRTAATGTVATDHLSIAAAAKAAQAALAAAQKADQHVSVAVVDRNGNTVVTLRGDGAGPQSYRAAEAKAFTAVSWNAPTSALTKRLEQAPTLKDIPGTLFLAGGAPVQAEGAPIAGIGVAGAPSGDLDEQFAQAGVAALNG
ncbi:heme-binding protein [Streptomyces sp. RS10V-4]|uniref:GlcG/HbpS family heme-binding protein n=1 Tax=Streptomyces rhizoryzae TaxID=2932493 RepID=UPI0020030C8E|nr:heme-binding protein [Streptomyces rhizoryzae]MCK7622272.1 heme-binding protein [Streptomyces rhizoryzae]